MNSKNLYFISRNYKFSKNAASKPKMDCETVLEKNGFKNLGFKQSNHSSSAIGAIISFFGITKGLFLLPRKSVFCMQYPLSKFFGYITTIVSLKKCTLIIIIHDVKYLMGKSKDLKGEIAKFNKADFIIVHNESMKKWFQKNGCTAQLVSLELFDYIHGSVKHAAINTPYDVVFAGGLGKEKSEFLYSMDNLTPSNYKLKLYGNGFNAADVEQTNSILDYQGVFSPDEVIDEIQGSFGLIWNGNALNECSGDFGKYLLYNNPHKTSLYLLCGLPVIVWKKAAIAKFVEKKQIGITLNSLNELDTVLANLDPKEYATLISNVEKVKTKVASGYYLSQAINKVVELI
ncbi:beta-1,6-galactofuranosyltransferase [Maribacter hydrothermalis]|uniref:Beta-1,6-galactofuranosyltransferase n=1 Tax=Maribacter hydrothermalis TaxID=1836467 RepID=A0A1B7Z1N5_9FLAO|nr:beta-1,6-galactofuranosyltransferase [Maribacter hydrothermalis]APQ18273.1 beta-1,6-galactofuranosyltransferase [Maribacter hydrothermalis]OBR36619.1 beta-1,6-galactofuranosyltransferase [Maribacter hydrothermalis]